MASVAFLPAMTSEEDNTLHPFFRKVTSKLPGRPLEEEQQGNQWHGSRGNKNAQGIGGPFENQIAGEEQPQFISLGAKDHERQQQQPARRSLCDGTRTLTDVDADTHKDKRRRLSVGDDDNGFPSPSVGTYSLVQSAVPTQSWHEQLQIAAQNQTTANNVHDHEPPLRDAAIIAIPTDIQEANKDQVLSGQSLVDMDAPRGVASEQHTSPKRRMLKIRADGKLTSPVHKVHADAPQDAAPRKRGRPALPRTSKSKKRGDRANVVILGYSMHTEAGTGTGAIIDEILLGARRIELKVKADTNAEAKAPKTQEPPRITHPFFLGKKGKKEECEQKNGGAKANDHDESGDSRFQRPRASAVTPGKLRAEALLKKQTRSADVPPPPVFASRPRLVPAYGSVKEAAWPSCELAHVRGLEGQPDHSLKHYEFPTSPLTSRSRRKMKGNATFIGQDEDILEGVVRNLGRITEGQRDWLTPPPTLRLPERHFTTGRDIQRRISNQIQQLLQPESMTDMESPKLDVETSSYLHRHHALADLYDRLRTTLTPFDKGEYETKAWVNKYSPASAAQVLQSGKEAFVLRDWLKASAVDAVEAGNSAKSNSKPPKEKRNGPKKKRRKRAEDIDGFVVSSDEEANEMAELSEEDELLVDTEGSHPNHSRSVYRTGDQTSSQGITPGKLTNAILLSGPYGCGKTAAVYAVAKELGFEIFEVNSGMRRSGKDIMEKVGDMTENHLVNHNAVSKDEPSLSADEGASADEAFQRDLATGRQGTMNTFFKSLVSKSKPVKPKAATQPAGNKGTFSTARQPQSHQKQSLILLEEVDVLFEEDKQFWSTILELLTHSKRPVVMTCNDESLLPLGALSLHAILRFQACPVDLATDYLLLVAANEGHLIDRVAVSTLYRSKRQDLRASIAELQFWCQMAVGDRRGGIDWMYPAWPPEKAVDNNGERIRVASSNTYQRGMGWFSRDADLAAKVDSFDQDEEFMVETFRNWKFDSEEWHNRAHNPVRSRSSLESNISTPENLQGLRLIEQATETLSAFDYCFRREISPKYMEPLDATEPPLSEKIRESYTTGYTLLEASPAIDFNGFDLHANVTALLNVGRFLAPIQQRSSCPPLSEATMVDEICDWRVATPQPLKRTEFSAAFDPIAFQRQNGIAEPSSGLVASAFDRTFGIITTDLAPYVRNIIAHEQHMDAQRLKRSNLLSAGGQGGTKRLRNTRASRSALDGGKRETARRARWFEAQINPILVLRTGGRGWENLTLVRQDSATETNSEVQSVASSQDM